MGFSWWESVCLYSLASRESGGSSAGAIVIQVYRRGLFVPTRVLRSRNGCRFSGNRHRPDRIGSMATIRA